MSSRSPTERSSSWRDVAAMIIVLLLLAILFTGFSTMTPKEQEQLIWFFILTG